VNEAKFGDKAYILEGIICPVNEMLAPEREMCEVAGFGVYEWDGRAWVKQAVA
jgi:hypothetical protein